MKKGTAIIQAHIDEKLHAKVKKLAREKGLTIRSIAEAGFIRFVKTGRIPFRESV
jgi:antitoxin component of RelBE/YafQ-DinJ toxin-antitoxin module